MVAFQRLVSLLGLCLSASANFNIYNATTLEDVNVGDACVKAMAADIACPAYIRSFMQPRYHGSLNNVALTDEICTGTCSASLKRWFNTVRYGGYIWAGWNETCIKDPKTKKYCNELEKVYKTCGGSGPTEIPPLPKVEEPVEYCLTNRYHVTKEGDTCDSIAKAYLGVAGIFLYTGNQNLIGDCRDLPAGLKLCLPSTCPTYVGLMIDDVEYYNSWINADCTNLHKATDFYGKSICIGPFGADSPAPSFMHSNNAPVARVSLKFSSANGPAVVLTDPPVEADVADGTTMKCGLWHVIKEGETCENICAAHNICEEDVMYTVNPSLPQDTDKCTKSLVPGEALCVAPISGWNTTYESTGPAEK
ncbi:hypothetical protein FALBO_6306 [Fusarium albosuccineum]|uniref:LysM domain-containing protein n=1 Tax=Fusarium albosuccineum TaxID=1237068 RepID=A0A8H4PK39_9HYPO|nr:hypothetical protein FALBO_6306 [Fusarium albosuccineum]